MWASTKKPDGEEVCFIDSGIKSLRDVPLHQGISTINLHCNHIPKIENLQRVWNLCHLDLSSNQIVTIEGLSGLPHLRTLNLSCNLIEVVQGLANLRSLVKLNLSYNQIRDISGFTQMRGPEYRLSQLELHGNRLQSLKHVTQCLSNCVNLRNLALAQSGADNPICRTASYRRHVVESLPHLNTLDGLDKEGRTAVVDDILADIPGLDQYLEYLISSESSQDLNPVALATPNIDAALDLFKRKGVSSTEISTSVSAGAAVSTTDIDTSNHESPGRQKSTKSTPSKEHKRSPQDHEVRLEKLEHQLTQLLYGGQTKKSAHLSENNTFSKTKAARVGKLRAKRDTDATDESEGETPQSQKRGSRFTATRGSSKKESSTTVNTSTSGEDMTLMGRKTSSPSRAKGATVSRKQTNKSPARKKGATPGVQAVSRPGEPSAVVADEQLRDDLQSTYLQLMSELETERERRWKAEQATKKLVEHVKELQGKVRDEGNLQEVAVEANTHLKQTITNERESKIRMQAELELTQEQVSELQEKLESSQKNEDEQRKAIQNLESQVNEAEREKLKQQTHDAKKVQESQLKAAAVTREVELLRNNVKTLKSQLQQLQELLATREQEHRKELEGRYRLESPELREILSRECARNEASHKEQLKQHQIKIDELAEQYSHLEDEFRLALQLEASRFQELKGVYERTSEENAQNKQALLAANTKNEKSTSIINELTSMVKEQKGRITELSKAKQEQSQGNRERIATLEAHVEEARRRMLQLEMYKKEKTKLESQIQAQESVIEGLRAERKLWAEELAQQGSALAQDRGRMEAKIEAQSSEISTLKKQLEREADAVRIKSKMIEDQTDTIRKLKEAIIERDDEVRKAREESLQSNRDLEAQLSAETSANQDLQDKLDRARERKEELKQQVSELEDELQESKKAHGILNSKWKEKSNFIGDLEGQVRQMRTAWEEKEKKLMHERDRAIEAARAAVDKLRSMDDAFRKQMDSKEVSHAEEIAKLKQQKLEETDLANQKVLEVEEEMRELLRDTAQTKKVMEDRVKKLTRAFSELQDDFLH